MTDQQTEALIKEHGADVAPRVTREQIEAVLVSEHYFTARDGLVGALMGALVARGVPAAAHETGNVVPQPPQALSLVTFCVLVLRNGHRIVGVNEGPVSAGNFDAELGRKLARDDAIDQVWPLEGYLLKQMLHVASMDTADALKDQSRSGEGHEVIRRALDSGDPEAIKQASSSRSAVVS